MKLKLKQQLKAALIAGCLIAPMSSMAATWGTGASSSTSDCVATGTSTCNVGTNGSFGPYVDNVDGATASSSFSDGRGAAEAHASIIDDSGIEMVHLRGQADSNSNGIAHASAWGLNTYTYTGANTTITLDIDLTGTLNNASGSSFTNISADIYVIDPADLNGMPFTDLSGSFGEGIFPIAETSVSIGGSDPATDSLSLTLNNGDEFSIWAILFVDAGNGDSAQAMNSLDLTFSSNTGLVSTAQVSAVPVPAAVWLFGSGLLGLIAVARRKRQ